MTINDTVVGIQNNTDLATSIARNKELKFLKTVKMQMYEFVLQMLYHVFLIFIYFILYEVSSSNIKPS